MAAPRTGAGKALEPTPDEICKAQKRAVDALMAYGSESRQYKFARDAVNAALAPGKELDLIGLDQEVDDGLKDAGAADARTPQRQDALPLPQGKDAVIQCDADILQMLRVRPIG